MAKVTSSGTIFRVGTTAANAATDTYTDVGDVANVGKFGRVYKEIAFEALSSRNTEKFKGTYNDGTLQLQLGQNLSNAGQAALFAALDSDAEFNFQIELNDKPDEDGTGTLYTFKGRVMSFETDPAKDQVVGAAVTIGISKMVSTTAPAAGTP